MSKKNYICITPFINLEVHPTTNFMCCPSWLPETLPGDIPLNESFNSETATKVRDSVLDGSFKYCDANQCPLLQKVESNNIPSGTIFRKDNIPDNIQSIIDSYKRGEEVKPMEVQFTMDQSCNLHCPSCRVKMIMANSNKIKEVNLKIDEIETLYADSVTSLYITGSGDPFISVSFRNFLRNFDAKKYPKLTRIHLHTNATKWNKEMWESMKSIWPYVKSCEISIDAATKDTYENKTRLGGKWDDLIENLKFISTIKTINTVKTSFVVQKSNYKEMKLFRDMMVDIFKTKTRVYFGKILNWGHMSETAFNDEKVWDETHLEHSQFLKSVNESIPHHQVSHNMYEFLNKKKSLI